MTIMAALMAEALLEMMLGDVLLAAKSILFLIFTSVVIAIRLDPTFMSLEGLRCEF